MADHPEDESALKRQLNAAFDNITELRRQNRQPGQKYVVYVDDNFHFMDEDERIKVGEFETEEAAIAAAKQVVDRFFTKSDYSGSTPESLFRAYTQYGEDPFIPGVAFKAWEYARQRCEELCRPTSES